MSDHVVSIDRSIDMQTACFGIKASCLHTQVVPRAGLTVTTFKPVYSDHIGEISGRCTQVTFVDRFPNIILIPRGTFLVAGWLL